MPPRPPRCASGAGRSSYREAYDVHRRPVKAASVASPTAARRVPLAGEPRRSPVDEAAGGADREHERRCGGRSKRDAVDLDYSGGVDRDPQAVVGGVDRRGAGDDREAEVDAVAVEDAREAPADDAADPASLHRQRDMLARRADAEVRADDKDRSLDEALAELRVEALEEILRHLVRVLHVEVRAGIHDVRVDVVAFDDERDTLDSHLITSGWTSSPATAAAAATHAFARYTPASGDPMRPRKFRFVVATAFSPGARMPLEPPKHAPQVGVETIAPASTNRSSRPSAEASRQIA